MTEMVILVFCVTNMAGHSERVRILLDTIYAATETLEDVDDGEEAAEAAYKVLCAGVDKYLEASSEQAQS